MTSWRILVGDCREQLRTLPAGSVQTCVTSPPYFGLRDYGAEGQIGLEPTPDEFVAALVEVFREVRRVLRDDGTVWLNLGDSYAGGGGGNYGTGKNVVSQGGQQVTNVRNRPGWLDSAGVKAKDLIGVPWMVAFALRADGWYLRSDIVWSKPNPMPESVTDRPTRSHEYVFLLSKSARYYYDADAIREDHAASSAVRAAAGYAHGGINAPDRNDAGYVDRPFEANGRNKRSVWQVATQPYAGAHFATFPPKLIEPCVLAGSAPRACGVCGAPWRRVVERSGQPPEPEHRNPAKRLEVGQAGNVGAGGIGFRASRLSGQEMARWKAENPDRTVGWESSCEHQDDTGSSVVLDPFAGAGTTGLVALRHDRSFIGCELNPEYAELARNRIRDDAPLLNGNTEEA